MKIRVQERKHPRYKWEVVCPKKIFGVLIRKPFKTKAEANAHKIKLENDLLDQKEGKLDPDVRVLMQRFQKLLSVDEIHEALEAKLEDLGKCDMTFKEVGDELIEKLKTRLKRKAITKDHLKDYVTRVPLISGWLGGPKLKDINEAMLDDFIEAQLSSIGHLGKKKSPRTIKNYISTVSGVMNYAIKQGYLTKNVTHDITLEHYKPEVGILTPDEIKQLLKHANYHMTCMIMFGCFGGLRSSEIRMVRWEDVRLDERQFYVKGKKNSHAERWIQLTPPLQAWCEKMLEGGRTGLVMNPTKDQRAEDENGKPLEEMRERLINYQRQKLSEQAGVVMSKNCLRHSFGSHHLVKYGNSHITAGEMGHYTPQTTFAHYRKEVLKSQAEAYWKIRAKAVEEGAVAKIAA